MIRKLLVLLAALAIAAISAPAALYAGTDRGAGQGAVIRSVEARDYQVELRLSGDFSPEFSAYKLDDPKVAVVEIPEAGVAEGLDRVVTHKAGILEVRFKRENGGSPLARVELTLSSPAMDIRASRVGDSLFITALARQSAEAPAVKGAAPAAKPAAPAITVTGLKFTEDKKQARLIIEGDGALDPKVFAYKDRIIVDVPGVKVSAKAPKTTAPVKSVRVGSHSNHARIVLDMEKEGMSFFAANNNKTVVISIPLESADAVDGPADDEVARIITVADNEAAPAEAPAGTGDEAKRQADQLMKDVLNSGSDEQAAPQKQQEGENGQQDQACVVPEKKYQCKLVTLDFQDAEVKPIYRFFADVAGYNLVIDKSVGGTITLKLMNVPWHQALDIVLKQSGHDKSIEGNIMTIAPAAVFIQQREAARQLRESQQKAAETIEKTYQLQYISPGALKDVIERKKALSAQGSMDINDRLNTITIKDSEEILKAIETNIIAVYDVQELGERQILIEAKIVTVSTTYSRTFGIRWGGSIPKGATVGNQDIDFSVNTPVGTAGSSASVQGGAIAIGWAESMSLNLSLSALETAGKSKSLANPRILTLDKKAATITQGTQIPYATQAEGGGTKIDMASASLSLGVTPTIRQKTKDGRDLIHLLINVSNNEPATVAGAAGPAIATQSLNTEALVKDGDTLVIGGIYKLTEDESEVRVPLLADIPVLGWLFKTRNYSKSPKELLIFITPTIVDYDNH